MDKIEHLWQMYEESVRKEMSLKKQEEATEENGFVMIDRCTQNGISNGILRCIEALDSDHNQVWQRSFHIFCKTQGINTDTGFGFWVPLAERPPEKEDTYICTLDGELCGIDEPFVGMCGFENGEWDEKDCVLAWMPMPEPYKKKR